MASNGPSTVIVQTGVACALWVKEQLTEQQQATCWHLVTHLFLCPVEFYISDFDIRFCASQKKKKTLDNSLCNHTVNNQGSSFRGEAWNNMLCSTIQRSNQSNWNIFQFCNLCLIWKTNLFQNVLVVQSPISENSQSWKLLVEIRDKDTEYLETGNFIFGLGNDAILQTYAIQKVKRWA